MKHGTWTGSVAVAMAMAAMAVEGATLALWNTSDIQPSGNSSGNYSANETATGVTAGALRIGSGLDGGSSSAAGVFAAHGYDKTNAPTAMNAGDYWETSLTAAEGNELLVTNITVVFGGPPSGPKACQLAWRTDNEETWTFCRRGFDMTRSDKPVYFTNSLAASELGDLAYGVSGTVRFRLVAWGGKDTAQACGSFGQKTDVLVFNGEVRSTEGVPPTVAFSPASPWTYVTNTLTVTVKARPGGAGVTAITVDPTPKGGMTNDLTKGTWTFTPAKADSNQTFTVTAVATNAYGTTTNSVGVRVKGAVTTGTMTIDFEGVTADTTRLDGETLELPTDSGTSWALDGAFVRNGDDRDRKNEEAALVFMEDKEGSMTSQGKLLPSGISEISYCYGVNEDFQDAGRPSLTTLLSEDKKLWVEADQVEVGTQGTLTERRFKVGVGVPVYLRFQCDGFPGSAQVNLDDVVIQPVAAPGAYDAWLLQHNVTPGDPGTAQGEDLDGDNYPNGRSQPGYVSEFLNNPKTNPYDPDDHP